MCGYAITSEGKLDAVPVTEGMPGPKRRIVLGALRILTRFDRLSMMAKKLGFVPQRFPDGSVSTAVILKGKIVNGMLQGQYADKFETGLFVFNLARSN